MAETGEVVIQDIGVDADITRLVWESAVPVQFVLCRDAVVGSDVPHAFCVWFFV